MLSANLKLAALRLRGMSQIGGDQLRLFADSLDAAAADAAAMENVVVPPQARAAFDDPKVVDLAKARERRTP